MEKMKTEIIKREQTDLRSHEGILDEIEEIVTGVKNGSINSSDAKIRMWGCKNAIRVMALKMIEERFALNAIPNLPRLPHKKN